MIFEINVDKKNYSYDLGSSKPAMEACRGLGIYKKTSIYNDLRLIFANLSWVVSNGNPLNRQACLATKAFALSVFPTLNEYQKLFVACAVTSIYERAGYSIPEDWVKAQGKYSSIIQKGFNPTEALNAGIAYTNEEGKMVVLPIPKYSE